MISLPRGELLDSFGRRLQGCWTRVLRPSCTTDQATRARDALAVGLGLLGLRWEEVSRVEWRHVVGPPVRSIDVQTAKGGRRRQVQVGRSWMDACDCLPRFFRDGSVRRRDLLDMERRGYVFVTGRGGRLRREHVGRRLAVWTRRHFGRSFSFHCLRHTFACRVYEETRDLITVQRALGHASLRWTETYLRSMEPVNMDRTMAWPDVATLRIFNPSERRA